MLYHTTKVTTTQTDNGIHIFNGIKVIYDNGIKIIDDMASTGTATHDGTDVIDYRAIDTVLTLRFKRTGTC